MYLYKTPHYTQLYPTLFFWLELKVEGNSRAKQRLPIPQPHPSDGEAERPEEPSRSDKRAKQR